MVLKHYGDKCTCCGETRREFFTLDHVNNDGAKFRRIGIKGQEKLWYWIIRNNYPNVIQILCWNCNAAKAFYGCCPHKSEAVVAERSQELICKVDGSQLTVSGVRKQL